MLSSPFLLNVYQCLIVSVLKENNVIHVYRKTYIVTPLNSMKHSRVIEILLYTHIMIHVLFQISSSLMVWIQASVRVLQLDFDGH